LFDFLNSEGTGNNLKAEDFAEGFRATKDQKVQRIINQDLHAQVFHFNKNRETDEEGKVSIKRCEEIARWIEDNFARFLSDIGPQMKDHWNADRADPQAVRAAIVKQQQGEQGLSVKVTPSASSGGLTVVSYRSTGPTRPYSADLIVT
jgi:hypothetical protein